MCDSVSCVTETMRSGNNARGALRRVCNEPCWRNLKSITYYAVMKTPITRPLRALLALAGFLLLSSRADAQPAAGQNARLATRAELHSALSLYDSSAASPAYSERTRARARAQASAVRSRLLNGDFRVGDRILLFVQGPTQLVDSTLAVGDSLVLDVPGIRRVRLHGVLRSELESVLLRDVGEVVREPRVTARPLLRLAVLGQVIRPGFVSVPSQMLVDQLITESGGPSLTADLGKLRFVRGDTTLLEGVAVSRAITQGSTLDALELRDGDALIVPLQSAPWDRGTVMQIAGFVLTPLLTLVAVRR